MKEVVFTQPIHRSALRIYLGKKYYRFKRYLTWYTDGKNYAKGVDSNLLPYIIFTHQTPLLRELANVDMRLQHNKIINLRLAAKQLSGAWVEPSETFSYWHNKTNVRYQLHIYLTDTHLVGEWRADCPPLHTYEIYEKKHWITQEFWGGYVRHNQLFRHVYAADKELIDDEFVTENHAIMMYEPMLSDGT